uniref:Uncharacterized protein n=1 Tax=Panagrolaimus davidi TaxID=227884 RepID=A0A914Q7H5_9BILA
MSLKVSTIQIFCLLFIGYFEFSDAIWTKNLSSDLRRYSNAFGSLADKYANVKMSRKEIINELQGLSRKA